MSNDVQLQRVRGSIPVGGGHRWRTKHISCTSTFQVASVIGYVNDDPCSDMSSFSSRSIRSRIDRSDHKHLATVFLILRYDHAAVNLSLTQTPLGVTGAMLGTGARGTYS